MTGGYPGEDHTPPSSTRSEDLPVITEKQVADTFRTNIFGYIFMTQAALPRLKKGAAIVNTTSVTAYRGSEALVDYASTKARSSPLRDRCPASWQQRASG